jgi:galactose mutarotase-like enzyme
MYRAFMRSGMLTGMILIALIVGLGIAYHERGRGNLHKLKQRIGNDRPEAPTYRPGGQDPINLTRSRLMGDSAPEFTSVTLLPGRGMNVLQITAFVPGKGEINLLASPTVEEATKVMTGAEEDAGGAASLSMGGVFEAPWAGRLWTGFGARPIWRGREIPTAPTGSATQGEAGLLLAEPSTTSDQAALPDGGQAQASFQLGKDPVQWPWRTLATVTVLLSSKSIDLTITARNNGDTTEPVALGWRPRIAIDGDRSHVKLRLPTELRVVSDAGGSPTGAVVPVAGTPYDFTPRQGVRLGTTELNDSFTGMRQDLVESGPVAELVFPAGDYGLRMTALTPTIKAMHVVTRTNMDYVVLDPRFNYPDPFGREWAKAADTGVVVLQPGQSVQWKVRLEIFSPTSDVTDH